MRCLGGAVNNLMGIDFEENRVLLIEWGENEKIQSLHNFLFLIL